MEFLKAKYKDKIAKMESRTFGRPKVPTSITDPTTTPPTSYFRGQYLGKGAYATCYKLISTKYPYIRACKVSKIEGVREYVKERILAEVAIHTSLEHRNIVQLHSSFEENGLLYMVLEYCENRSLMEMLEQRGHFTESETAYFMHQICSGLVYLHEEKHIIHHDLKLANVFVTVDRYVKIGDFGLATVVHELGSLNMSSCGTPNYIAPEIWLRTGHSFAVDIWSLGVMGYFLLTGNPPFRSDSLSDQKRLVIKGRVKFPANISLSHEAVRFIKRIFQVDPTKRPTARQLLTDEFVTRSALPRCFSFAECSSGSSSSAESSSDDGSIQERSSCSKHDRTDEVVEATSTGQGDNTCLTSSSTSDSSSSGGAGEVDIWMRRK